MWNSKNSAKRGEGCAASRPFKNDSIFRWLGTRIKKFVRSAASPAGRMVSWNKRLCMKLDIDRNTGESQALSSNWTLLEFPSLSP
jgi:hypothetical protein